MKLVKFLPSYVGSKAYWVERLQEFKGAKFIELFCGSAVLSANLASQAILNDLDPFIVRILQEFETLIVPTEFTKEQYFDVRKQNDWYRYSYCLMKMAFSGVFRYSRNGFNVPIKQNLSTVHVKDDYLKAVERYVQLRPKVLNINYTAVPIPEGREYVVVLDPPYETAQAAYNAKFDYHTYWLYVGLLEGKVKHLILFDKVENLPFHPTAVRKMRVNGKHKGSEEAMFIFKESLKVGKAGEEAFYNLYKEWLERLYGLQGDFILKDSGDKLELKSDYYDTTRTPNFFIERYSDRDRRTPGGPWQAREHGCKYFVYFYPKNKEVYLFNVENLINDMDNLVTEYGLKLVEIANQSWTTVGYLINRDLLKHIYKRI